MTVQKMREMIASYRAACMKLSDLLEMATESELKDLDYLPEDEVRKLYEREIGPLPRLAVAQ